MASDTRELLLDRAESLFAERGFYGVSIAAIANELGLTKQALLHHYGSKERLYGEVLKRISTRFETETPASDDPTQAFKSYILKLQNPMPGQTDSTRVLMRELLDNKRRADTAGTWYLKPFLEHCTAMLKAIPNWREASDVEAFAMVYQLLGAINYYGISAPTLTGIFGAETYAEIDQTFPGQMERLIDAAIDAGPRSTK
ncbi:MAG: TetR/AcrR family transcriptional regulator [Pseudomonadota bacterium]